MLRAIAACGLVALLVLGLASCGDKSTNAGGAYNQITLDPVRLPTLKSGLVYDGWVVNADKDSNWISYQEFGKFFYDQYNFRFLDAADTTRDRGASFKLASGSVYDYNMIAITLEPFPNDPDPKPSPTIIAVSAIDPTLATVMVFPRQFGSSGNSFCIATFSDGDGRKVGDTTSEREGIWFLQLTLLGNQNGLESYQQGLNLPTLPDTGYLYEGWVALNGGDTVSTGKFFSPSYVDYDNRHCVNGAIPNFPGEDFLANRPENVPASRWPLDMMRGGTAFITLEPNPDNDVNRPSPFVLLSGNLPTNHAKARTASFDIGYPTSSTMPRIRVTYQQVK
jgi:hypothetical protein